jgi:hypothetical protein
MKTHEAILSNLQSARFIMSRYLEDLRDEDLIVRPHPHAHHAAWQLGHLVLSESQMLRAIYPDAACGVSPEFLTKHEVSAASKAQLSDFYPKSDYLSLMQQVRSATVAAVAKFSEQQFSEPGPERMRNYAPTIGAVFLAIANHEIMHTGQIAVIRRALGKPVVI